MTPDFWLPDLTDKKKNGWAFYLHYTKDAADGMVGVCHKTGEIGHLFVTEAARGKGTVRKCWTLPAKSCRSTTTRRWGS